MASAPTLASLLAGLPAKSLRVVLDTNVLVSALLSARGASRVIVDLANSGAIRPIVSVALMVEYEAVLKRPGLIPSFTPAEAEEFLDNFATHAEARSVFFRWRPFLPDPNDDMLVEIAVAAGASHLVTSNVRDFLPAHSLGLSIITPKQFLDFILQLPLP